MSITVLITGANRGIGLEFVQQYAEEGCQVIACCRQPEQAKVLQQLAKNNTAISIMPLEMTDVQSLKRLAQALSLQALDVVIANAGVMGESGVTLGNIKAENMLRVFQVNAVAQLQLIDMLLPSLQAGTQKKIVAITSKMGSIADNQSGKSYAYRASKSALNMIMKSMSIDLLPQGFTVLLLHPGWVQTEMGGPQALISVQESVQGMKETITEASPECTGNFYDYQGKTIPW